MFKPTHDPPRLLFAIRFQPSRLQRRLERLSGRVYRLRRESV